MTLTSTDHPSIGSTGLNFGGYAMTQDADNSDPARAGSLESVVPLAKRCNAVFLCRSRRSGNHLL